MDTDLELAWEPFKHLYPHFSYNHLTLYRLLWRIEPLTADQIIKKSVFSKPTVYKILNDLIAIGLVKKTNLNPPSYFAENPVKTYDRNANNLIKKLKKGKNDMQKLVQNSSGLSGELYLIERDGGQKRLISKNSRQSLLDEFQLREIKKVAEQQLIELEHGKTKAWAVYR